MLNKNEKTYLNQVVTRELEKVKKTKKGLFIGMSKEFLKAEHEYEHFLENLIKKL